MSEWGIRSKIWAFHSFAYFLWVKWAIRSHRSFLLSDLSKSHMVAHFCWAKWAIHLNWHCSFDLINLSKSLTVAHLIWAKWAMSEWANSQPWNPYKAHCRKIATNFQSIISKEQFKKIAWTQQVTTFYHTTSLNKFTVQYSSVGIHQ